MAKYRIKGPDGQTYEVNAPDTASQDEVLAYAQKQFAGGSVDGLSPDNQVKKRPGQPQTYIPSGERETLNWTSPEVLAQGPAQFARAAAALPLAGAQMFDHAVSDGSTMDNLLQRNKQIADHETGTVYDSFSGPTELAGEIVGPGAAAAKLLKTPASFLGRSGQAAALGTAMGLGTPAEGGEDFVEQKGAQALGGGIFGGLIPGATALASKVGKTAYHGLIEPLYERGREAIKGRAYLDAAGDKVGEIVNLLRGNKQIVPGSAPTAGEAAAPAGRTEFSALQESARGAKPSEYSARTDQQNAARVDSLREWAGTPAKRAEAVESRAQRTGPHYAAGEASASTTDGLETLSQRPSFKAVLGRTDRGLAEKDKVFEDLFPNGLPRQMSGEEAQRMKLAFDDMIKLQPKGGIETTELADLQATRGEFIKWMEQRFPDLGTGRKLYKMTSAPVNQMDVGEELVNKLTPALREEGKQRGSVFAGAIRDSASTIKKATGEPRFERLEQVLTGKQLGSVHNVQDDLARSDRHMELARRGTGSADATNLGTMNLEQQVGGKARIGLLDRTAMLMNAIIARMEGKVDRKLAAEMALDMLHPPGVAGSLENARAAAVKNAARVEALLNMQRPAAVAAGGAAGFGLQGD